MTPYRLTGIALLFVSMMFVQGCYFLAGAATGVAATEAAEEIDDDDDE